MKNQSLRNSTVFEARVLISTVKVYSPGPSSIARSIPCASKESERPKLGGAVERRGGERGVRLRMEFRDDGSGVVSRAMIRTTQNPGGFPPVNDCSPRLR